MRVPQTDRRVALEGRVTTPDGAGGFSAGWLKRGELWAAFTPAQGSAGQEAGQPSAASRYRVIIRAAEVGSPRRPLAGERLVEGPRRFDILTVGDSALGRGWLSLLVEEEVMR